MAEHKKGYGRKKPKDFLANLWTNIPSKSNEMSGEKIDEMSLKLI